MVKSFVRSIQALAVVAAMSCAAFVGSNAMAAAVTGDLAIDGNTAVTFDPSTATPVTVRFTDPNIATNTFFQLGFRTNDGSLTSIPATVEYSFDNVTYQTFYFGSTPVGFAPAYSYGANLGPWTASGSQDIYFKYTIPAGAVANSKVINVNLLSNNNGFNNSGVLGDNLSNGYTDLTRTHTSIDAPAVPEPTTFAIASIGLGLAGAARMRKRAKKA
jgi:hypothetical protein